MSNLVTSSPKEILLKTYCVKVCKKQQRVTCNNKVERRKLKMVYSKSDYNRVIARVKVKEEVSVISWAQLVEVWIALSSG